MSEIDNTSLDGTGAFDSVAFQELVHSLYRTRDLVDPNDLKKAQQKLLSGADEASLQKLSSQGGLIDKIMSFENEQALDAWLVPYCATQSTESKVHSNDTSPPVKLDDADKQSDLTQTSVSPDGNKSDGVVLPAGQAEAPGEPEADDNKEPGPDEGEPEEGVPTVDGGSKNRGDPEHSVDSESLQEKDTGQPYQSAQADKHAASEVTDDIQSPLQFSENFKTLALGLYDVKDVSDSNQLDKAQRKLLQSADDASLAILSGHAQLMDKIIAFKSRSALKKWLDDGSWNEDQASNDKSGQVSGVAQSLSIPVSYEDFEACVLKLYHSKASNQDQLNEIINDMPADALSLLGSLGDDVFTKIFAFHNEDELKQWCSSRYMQVMPLLSTQGFANDSVTNLTQSDMAWLKRQWSAVTVSWLPNDVNIRDDQSSVVDDCPGLTVIKNTDAQIVGLSIRVGWPVLDASAQADRSWSSRCMGACASAVKFLKEHQVGEVDVVSEVSMLTRNFWAMAAINDIKVRNYQPGQQDMKWFDQAKYSLDAQYGLVHSEVAQSPSPGNVATRAPDQQLPHQNQIKEGESIVKGRGGDEKTDG